MVFQTRIKKVITKDQKKTKLLIFQDKAPIKICTFNLLDEKSESLDREAFKKNIDHVKRLTLNSKIFPVLNKASHVAA